MYINISRKIIVALMPFAGHTLYSRLEKEEEEGGGL